MGILERELYIQSTKKRKPISVLKKALKNVPKNNGNKALDLGCGAGVEAKYLAQKGFMVDAVDYSEESIRQTKKICEKLPVKIIKKNILDYKIEKEKYSIIVFWSMLFLFKKKEGKKIILAMIKGLTPKGILVFNFMGPNDEWIKNKELSLWNKEFISWGKEEIKFLLSELSFVKIDKITGYREPGFGNKKFWDITQIIVQKKN